MTDHNPEIERPEERVPRRVIGTPPPGAAQSLLGEEEAHHEVKVPGVKPQDPRTAKKGERIAALCFTITFLAGIAFIASYVIFQVGDIDSTWASNLALGASLTIALLGLAVGMVVWARMVLPKYNMVQERHPMASDPQVREEVGTTFMKGADESGFVKHKLLRRTLLAAAAPLGLAPLVLLKDLGPLPETKLRHTVWNPNQHGGKKLRLMVEGTGQPIRATDFNTPGGLLSVVPEGYEHDLTVLAKATVILINLRPEEIKSGTNKNWTHNGIVAYSKICTHVGCPAALYEQNTHHILCPCHQSTFDATDGAKVIFGPAARPLPQLPIDVDAEGYLIATGDFPVPVGPSFWERGDAEAEYREQGKQT
ncbi:Rieske 2Fe-2S domain-containing protein [Spongiactinospora sp. TRM90649]|uniref:cytochrome bc1 complex Rieske iron-sulfur subunit n=1 Tax=Spongiactinospora sp. TRM90649 TaxID=3031114 RepID=UPI0023F930F0|nr:Rieske 2Fe-2S domain-containing protein [Spongiactinospora sp. TRM90649]MDF5758497.1 Rieske 2Fe-2S domain-containing protein [Spongiactinospora sp. TRM90649]